MQFGRKLTLIIVSTVILLASLSANADVTDDVKPIKISGGGEHTLVIVKENNSVFGCGDNLFYQLGIGDTTADRWIFVQVHGLGDVNYLEDINDIASGCRHSLALDVNDLAWSWGNNQYGQLGVGEGVSHRTTPVHVLSGEQDPCDPNSFLQNIISISASREGGHSLAADSNHYCWAWGYNNYGQLGNGKDGSNEKELVPDQVLSGQQDPCETEPLKYIIAVSAGDNHSMALDSNGGVWTFGYNGNGRLGDNMDSGISSNIPVEVNGPNNVGVLENIVVISAGSYHCMALEKRYPFDPNCMGRVYAWGDNNSGKLGDSTTDERHVPIIVKSGEQDPGNEDSYLTGVIAISAGHNHSMALDVSGFVYTWGNNNEGQLGDGSNDSNTTPVKVVGRDGKGYLENIVEISAGNNHCIAIDDEGTIWTWGIYEDGRLGLGEISGNVNTPQPVGTICNKNKSTGYFSIQTAIDDASGGDVLELSTSRFCEDVDCSSKYRVLRSKDPNDPDVVEKTIIHGGDEGQYKPTINASSGNSTLKGLTITSDFDAVECYEGFVKIINCIIKDSVSGVQCGDDAYVVISNTSITDSNDAGVSSRDSSLTMNNCLVKGNKSHGINSVGSSVEMTDCNIEFNHGHGIFSETDYLHDASSLTVKNCKIDKNGDSGNDCGIYIVDSSYVIITNNVIRRNADDGIYFYFVDVDSANITVKNNWIHNNTGNGIYICNADFTVIIRNNTIFDNGNYGIIKYDSDNVTISNCILWENDVNQLFGCAANYSCIDGGGSGIGNIESDPCFIIHESDPNDYHLDPNSPCVDKGDTGPNYDNELDIDGEVREWDGDSNGTDVVDMGGDEYYWSPADYNKDKIVNFLDYAIFAKAWQSVNEDVSLDDDIDVDMVDLYYFRKEWLWQAGWVKGYTGGCKGFSEDGGFEKSSQGEQSTEKQEEEEINEEAIKSILEYMEDMWLNGDLKETMTEEQYLAFIKYLESCLE